MIDHGLVEYMAESTEKSIRTQGGGLSSTTSGDDFLCGLAR